MKISLNQNFVFKLTIDKKPLANVNGQLQYENNIKKTEYIVFDDHRDSPVGFGVKIGKTKKTYIIQRRVSNKKVIKAKVGNVSDFYSIDDARNKARQLVQVVKDTGLNPNAISRTKLLGEITLSEAFAKYREHLLGRPTPATKNTLDVFDRSVRKLSAWSNLSIRNLNSQEIINRFDEVAAKTRTSAEQTFRWANVAVNYAIALEAHHASSDKREPYLTHNPFNILKLNQKYRSRSELESAYKTKGIRKPLSIKDSMGAWLNSIVARRAENRTGCDYLLLSTLWGTRKNEALPLKWRQLISDTEASTSSYVDLDSRKVFFRKTKNGNDHELPITDAAYEILTQRRDLILEQKKNEKWVFPARSKYSKTGHYSDCKSLLKYLCQDAGITKIGVHDLRRTLGRVAEELCSYSVVKRIINHSNLSDPTSFYTEVEWNRLCENMQRIELHILRTAPSVFNMFLVSKHPLMNDG